MAKLKPEDMPSEGRFNRKAMQDLKWNSGTMYRNVRWSPAFDKRVDEFMKHLDELGLLKHWPGVSKI